MSLSKEWTEWHLTPRGWERGSERVDFAGTTTLPTPADAVLTSEYREEQSSVYSKMESSLRVVWRCDDEDAVADLINKHGSAPRRL